MEIKKNPKVDVQNKRVLLLEIGLAVSLLIVIAAFLYTPREYRIEQVEQVAAVVEEEITEITRQDQKPPEPPKRTEITVITDILNIVTNDEKISTNVDFAEFAEDVEIIQQVAVEEEVIEDDQPFVKVEQMPSFMGGDLMTFRNWVQSKVRFPQIAQENNISGRVLLMFVIERDGSLTNIQVLQTPDSSLSDEAIRVLKTSPKWTPGKQRNQSVRVKYTLPIDFRIQN
ncbi:MAG: energy transducer TonB [Alistipes sp.]|nr:energy transducer TonB [Alistipes sp.]MBP3551116.1 energy transducer TonB [Alistipes sp.]